MQWHKDVKRAKIIFVIYKQANKAAEDCHSSNIGLSLSNDIPHDLHGCAVSVI
jgi:hypothetical protein